MKQALKPKVNTDPTTVLPWAYKEFLKVFSLDKANKLPLHCPVVNHTIHMKPGTQPIAELLYNESRDKL